MERGGEEVPAREEGDTRGEGEWGSRGGGEGGGGGRGVASGYAEGGVEREHPRGPVDAGVVAAQPGKPQHKLEMTQPGELKGEGFCVNPMNA